MKSTRTSDKRLQLVVFGIVATLVFVSLLVSSFAWVIHLQNTDTTDVMIGTDDGSGFASFVVPAENNNVLKYSGEKGTTYSGADTPYVATYSPVRFYADAISVEEPYLKTFISKLNIVFTISDDETGKHKEKTYFIETKEGKEFLDNFTLRFFLKTVQYAGVAPIEKLIEYRPENGYLISVESSEPLKIEVGAEYIFELRLVFQSEENYNKLMTTKKDLDDSLATPISGKEYMYSDMQFDFNVSLAPLLKLNFDTNGGNDIDSMNITGGGEIVLPANPTRQGYTFEGWYSDIELSEVFTKDSLVAKPVLLDTTVYAKWTKNNIVTYALDNGEANITEEVYPGGNILGITDPTKDGYKFDGWSTNAERSDRVKLSEVETTDDITLYACWKKYINVKLIAQKTIGAIIGNYYIVDNDTGNKQAKITIKVLEGETLSKYLGDTKDYKAVCLDSKGDTKRTFEKWQTYKEGLYKDYDINTPIEADKTGKNNDDITLYASFD